VGRASLRFAAGHNLGREKPVNADFLPAFLAFARSQKKREIARQMPRVSITIRRSALAKRRLGRSELRLFSDWNDGRPETELNFKFYRQATNKIVGISDEAAALLRGFF
jgi:hypothetical protein